MKVKNLVLGIGIFIVFMLMLKYGIEAFYPSPQYNDFCKLGENGRYPAKFNYYDAQNCTFSQELRKSESQCYLQEGIPIYEYDDKGCYSELKKCDFCNKEYNESKKEYSKLFFVIAIVIGIISLLFGFVFTIEPVSSALMASGVGAIFYGSAGNWENLSDILRFLLLAVALVLLIWIAMQVNQVDKKKRWQFWK